jgi:hypothetical protein
MTASTNTVLVRHQDDTISEYSGAVYAEEALHAGKEVSGVAIQYMRQEDEQEPRTDFIEGGELVGVYDDICEEYLTESYEAHVTNNE